MNTVAVVSYDGIEKKLMKMYEIADIDQEAFDMLMRFIDAAKMEVEIHEL